MTALRALLTQYSRIVFGCCMRCEQANNGLSRGSHCGRCSCCSRRTR